MNIDKLKEVIQAANPEIMELKFGCEVLLPVHGINQKKIISRIEDRYVWFSDDVFLYVDEVKTEFILGRPIRLADVLLAIGNAQEEWRKRFWFTWTFFLYEGMGKDKEWAGLHAYSHKKGWAMMTTNDGTPIGWNLKDDNLDHQSDETKKFLTDLLIPN